MQFTESWLKSLVNTPLNTQELGDKLTMAGLEVEELEPLAPEFSGVVVGLVLKKDKHPDADRLSVCQVQVAEGDVRQIVCGAPNVAEGLKVPCALPGAELPGGFKIKPTKMRGVESGVHGFPENLFRNRRHHHSVSPFVLPVHGTLCGN